MSSEPLSRVAFTVLGEPQPQGSKTVVQQKGRRPRMIEDNPDTAPWRARVEAAAVKAMADRQVRTGPLRLAATFVFLRPAAHWGTGRNAGTLKASAPAYCRTRPDVDKLVRAVGDAITGIVCRDDAQLVIVHAEKHYGEPACAHLVVEELALDDDRAAPDPWSMIRSPTNREEHLMRDTPETTEDTPDVDDGTEAEVATESDPEPETETEADDPDDDE